MEFPLASELTSIAIPTRSPHGPQGLIVALHGWGANAADLASLEPILDLPEFSFIFPEAPFYHPRAAGGRMWYDLQRPDPSGILESRKYLHSLLESVWRETATTPKNTILMGFSQGGAMTLDIGLTLPLAGLVAFSGYLHPLERSDNTPIAIPPILIVHGRQDAVVPLDYAREARETLIGLGAAVEYCEYDMGHEILPAAIARARQFILERLPASPSA